MRDKITKTGIINYVLWMAFVLAMLSSVQHIAWTFGTVEQPGREWLGWIPAIAVDAGLAALAYTIQQRRKTKRSVVILWAGVAIFALISALANMYHALVVESGGITSLAAIGAIDPLLIAKAIFLSATLPALVVYLSEIVSGDDAAAAKASDDEATRQRRMEERAQDRADKVAATELLKAEKEAAEAKARLIEAERKQNESEAVPAESEVKPVMCDACGRSFRSVNARNAHKCEAVATVIPVSSNGKSH